MTIKSETTTKEQLIREKIVNGSRFGKSARKAVAVSIEFGLLLFLFIFHQFYPGGKLSVIKSLTDVGIIALFALALVLIAVFLIDNRINYFHLFYVLAYLFSFGQSFGFALGLIKPTESILNIANGHFTGGQIFDSAMFVLKSSVIFALGYTVFYKKVAIKPRGAGLADKRNMVELRILGEILLAISVIPTFYLVFKDVVILSNEIYANSKYVVTGIDKVFTLLSGFFDVGIILLLITEKRKVRRRFTYALLGLYCVLQMTGGSRYEVFKYAALLVLMFLTNGSKPSIKKIVIIIITVLALGLTFSVISILRQEKFDSLGEAIRFLVLSFGDEGFVSKVLYEAGITQLFNTLVYSNCPATVDYCYGAFILKAALGIIPNFGFWDVHPAGITTEIVFSGLYANFGLGSSLWMEAYWNFGETGAHIAFFILGLVFATLIRKLNTALNENNYLGQLIIYYFMFYFVISVRSDMVQIGRYFVYYVALPLTVYKLFIKNKIKITDNKLKIDLNTER